MRAIARFLSIVAISLAGKGCFAATYYVSPTGNDNAAGTSTSAAWRTIARVNSAKLSSGDQILFQRGGTWREMLVPNASGLYFGAYGTGARPLISGADVVTTAWSVWSGNICRSNVGGNDMTNVWINQVLGKQRTSTGAIAAPGDWYYTSAGMLYLYFAGGCSATASSKPVIEITRRPEALSLNGIGSIVVEHLGFINGMYNSILLGANLVGVQSFNDVLWRGAAYEGFLATSGTPIITNSEGLYSLSGLAAAGGAGFSITNSILSGNEQDAVEVYNTTGPSRIMSSTISGNATDNPISTTINNWADGALTVSNSVILPNPFFPSTYTFVGITDDGTNVQESPLFAQRAAPAIIVPFVDDYINLGVAQAVASVAAQYGCHLNYALNTKLVTAADWTKIQALQAAGNEIVAHTRSHSDLANNNVFTIAYTGSATKATMTVSQTAGNLQTFLNGSTTADLVVPILDKWNSIQNMCTAIASKPNYTCTIQTNQEYFTPLNLANVQLVNIKSPYTLQASSSYLSWEVEGSLADIKAGIPGYVPTSFATPFTSSSAAVESHIQNAGFLVNRNGIVDENLNPNGAWSLSDLDVYNLGGYWIPNSFDLTNSAGSVGALVEGLGAEGGVIAVYSHGYDEFSLANWQQFFQLLQSVGGTCMTMSQARAYIGSHGTLAQDGTKRRWVEAIPLQPSFANTSSSPTQGAHGLQ